MLRRLYISSGCHEWKFSIVQIQSRILGCCRLTSTAAIVMELTGCRPEDKGGQQTCHCHSCDEQSSSIKLIVKGIVFATTLIFFALWSTSLSVSSTDGSTFFYEALDVPGPCRADFSIVAGQGNCFLSEFLFGAEQNSCLSQWNPSKSAAPPGLSWGGWGTHSNFPWNCLIIFLTASR